MGRDLRVLIALLSALPIPASNREYPERGVRPDVASAGTRAENLPVDFPIPVPPLSLGGTVLTHAPDCRPEGPRRGSGLPHAAGRAPRLPNRGRDGPGRPGDTVLLPAAEHGRCHRRRRRAGRHAAALLDHRPLRRSVHRSLAAASDPSGLQSRAVGSYRDDCGMPEHTGNRTGRLRLGPHHPGRQPLPAVRAVGGTAADHPP